MAEESVISRLEGRTEKLFGEAPPEPKESVDQAEIQADDQVDADEPSEEAVEQPVKAVDEVEVETDDGWKGKIPASLKAELDKAADYTRGKQEVADQRRIMDAQRRVDQETQAFYQHASEEFKQLQAVEAQLERYKGVDLTTLDGETLSRMSMAAANLREERAKLKESLDSKKGEFKQKVVSAWDDMASKAVEAVSRALPDFEKNAPKIAQYAIDQGFPFELITGYDRQSRERVGPGVVDPTFAKTLYKAWRWDQLQSGKSTQTDKMKGAAPILKPGAADTRTQNEVSNQNFRKAMKQAPSDSKKAQIIGDRVAQRLAKRLGL